MKWRVSYKTLCKWLDTGILPDTKIIDGIVQIQCNKPLIPGNNAIINTENVRKYILKACKEFQYIDYRILGMKAEQFQAILLQLEEKKYIQPNSPQLDRLSNKHFSITEDGEAFLKQGKFQLESLNFEIGFSYKGIAAKLNGNLKKE